MTEIELETILLVEDNPSDARLIQEFLEEQSWPVQGGPTLVHVDRLADAVETRDDDVDIVLLDLGLPDSNGVETLDRMLAASGDEPVVVLTGLDDEQIGVEAVERGAQDYIVKGDLSPNLLQQTLRYAIERERQQHELERRNEELALLNRIVRHDIKNDVTVIIGWGDALREHVDPAGEEHLDRILSASEHITGIADTVGDFLEILDGEKSPELQPIDLSAVLQAEVQKAQTVHGDASITVTADLPDGLRVSATELLPSVFRNLLNNAVIHNDKETAEVVVDVEVRTETVLVRVADNGPGVPDWQKDEIFGRGEMGVESPGSGIGLYLVRTLADMYGGEVRIADRERHDFPASPPESDTHSEQDSSDSRHENRHAEPAGSVFTVTLQLHDGDATATE
jgi:signal transduction histidine kinase